MQKGWLQNSMHPGISSEKLIVGNCQLAVYSGKAAKHCYPEIISFGYRLRNKLKKRNKKRLPQLLLQPLKTK